MAKSDEKRGGGGIFSFGEIRRTIDTIPEPKGKFRNLFAERGMMPKPKRTCDCAQSERGAAGSRVTGA